MAVELVDHLVPGRDQIEKSMPELWISASHEVFDGNALLLHPGEVAKVEDAGSVDVRQLDQMVRGDAREVLVAV